MIELQNEKTTKNISKILSRIDALIDYATKGGKPMLTVTLDKGDYRTINDYMIKGGKEGPYMYRGVLIK